MGIPEGEKWAETYLKKYWLKISQNDEKYKSTHARSAINSKENESEDSCKYTYHSQNVERQRQREFF